MKDELAAQLREERSKLGLTIEEVVEETKLHPSVIKDLEAGNWDKINPTYLKGFLKIYCSFLGVKFDEAKFASFFKREKKEKKQPTPIVTPPASKKTSFSKKILLGGVTFFIILVVVLLFLRKISKTPPSLSSSRGRQIVVTTTPSPDKSQPLYVSVTAKRDCFVVAKVEGRIVFEGTLKRGVVESWKAIHQIEFKFSDGSAVEIEVNGKRLPPLTRLRQPIKSLKITPQGVSVEK
ncbi:MAG: hypothetical protein DRP81_01490 [Candidatus Omnitrophota bacterium]|nr:MAG: hypothetical protein DRP81_01490 [Candidatus Omnitrophota bacterium]